MTAGRTGRRPLIGITTQTLQSMDGIPEGLPHSWIMNRKYFDAVVLGGGVTVMVPLFFDDPETLRATFERLDGILIPGGVDMDPGTYGEEAHEKLGRIDPPRDRVESLFARWAREEGVPALGICRGLQVMSVAAGGSLWQDVEAQVPASMKHDYFPTEGWTRDHLAHDVELAPGSRIRDILGRSVAPVNSMHHQAIRTLGVGLEATAWAADGILEAAEDPAHPFYVGVQWHPESMEFVDPPTRRIFEALVDAAAERSRAVGVRG